MENIATENHLEANYIPVKTALTWDEYFMFQAMMASFKSKDPSTKVGAVFVDDNRHQLTMGYNGFVAGIDENQLPWGKDPSAPLEHQKYGYVVHAEANAILHSPRSLEGSTLYVTLFPCHECAKLIASSKCSEIVYLEDKHAGTQTNKIARKIFDLTGIKYRQIELAPNLVDELGSYFKKLVIKE